MTMSRAGVIDRMFEQSCEKSFVSATPARRKFTDIKRFLRIIYGIGNLMLNLSNLSYVNE